MNTSQPSKSGAALVIALGFLAVLTIMILLFSAQTRTERLAGHAYLSTAQTRQLLHTALTRAMEEIDSNVTGNYPSFAALHSIDNGTLMSDTIDFSTEEDYVPLGNSKVSRGYSNALNFVEWQRIQDAGSNTIGRVGYIIINTSGLLDANSVGGLNTDSNLIQRSSGLSPKEIQLTSDLLPDLNSSGELILNKGTKSSAVNGTHAFVYNRNTAWKRFESLRDVEQLNNSDRGSCIGAPISSFSTFSFSPPGDPRTFMGTNFVTVTNSIPFIRTQLESIAAIPDPEFVLNQLRDYLDTDTVPQNESGDYTDLFVEPVPLINELALTCNFTFFPQATQTTDDAGNLITEVTSVIITNNYELELEVWYPFVGYTNTESFTVHIDNPPIENDNIPLELFGLVSDWTHDQEIPKEVLFPGSEPYNYTIYSAGYGTEVFNENAMITLFESMQSDIQFPSIYCDNGDKEMVDRVLNLELPMDDAVSEELLPIIQGLASNFFSGGSTLSSSNQFVVGMACIDPRLNWDGTSPDQWAEATGADTMGEINESLIRDNIEPLHNIEMMYVRNADQIDTPYEFTYLLYDQNKPWATFQMLADNDTDGTRFITQNLSPYPNGPPKEGRINPHSPHTNIIASAFMNMPVDEFNSATRRLDSDEATDAAELFMSYVAENVWKTNSTPYGENIDLATLEAIVGDPNPWVLESFFRNSYELFNPRDTLFTILLVAQSKTGDEVHGTQKAVVYVWRDQQTGKSACVFYGLSDTLQSSIGSGESWATILSEFHP